jgi:signal peptidase I
VHRPGRRWARRGTAVLAALYLATLAVNRSLVVVRGPSMEPTLWPGDRLLTVPAHPWWLRPGQVVLVAPPEGPELVVKRVHHIERRRAGDGAGPSLLVDVRGDAPGLSTDSRWWGPLPRRRVRRVAVARWPDLRTRLWRKPADDPPPPGAEPRPAAGRP